MDKMITLYKEIEVLVIMEQMISDETLIYEMSENNDIIYLSILDQNNNRSIPYFSITGFANFFSIKFRRYQIYAEMRDLYDFKNTYETKEETIDIIKKFFLLGVFK